VRILVTNDDGIHAQGLELLAQVAARFGQVVVVAPENEMSAVSHGITLHRPLRAKAIAERTYIVDGTPADCVYIGVHQLMDPPPDLVLSGINHGPNLGHDVLYSGTVAGAMEGLIQGLPGIAFSVYGERHPIRPHVVEWVERLLGQLLGAREPGRPFCANVNIPNREDGTVLGVRTTRLGERVYTPAVERRTDPRGRDYFWIGSDMLHHRERDGTDFSAVAAGYVSVTALGTDLTDRPFNERLKPMEMDQPSEAKHEP
jgi:5'-nucleotidase